ncbi:MAG: M48 family metalloprotease [Saprospiraceae bacterium]|nr:M48 family metalloprotease [Saprospiraceae bacterium]
MKHRFLSILLLFFILNSCSTIKNSWNDLNVFPVAQDIELGKQVAAEISANKSEFPILEEKGNEVLYNYVNGLVQKILATNLVDYTKDFAWKVNIINDPKTLNAFCTPGGHIYVYTGLISFLDSEDELAGVMGHEMAHAAKRHSTKQLTKSLGVQLLLDAALGKKEVIKQVTGALLVLSFSRAHETQADSFSVKYLCPTSWKANGAAGFFRKIEGQVTPPQWLSTHPSPANRIKSIDSKSSELKCMGKDSNTGTFNQIKSLIKNIVPPPHKPSEQSDSGSQTPGIPNSSKPTQNNPDKAGPSNTNTIPQKKILKKG